MPTSDETPGQPLTWAEAMSRIHVIDATDPAQLAALREAAIQAGHDVAAHADGDGPTPTAPELESSAEPPTQVGEDVYRTAGWAMVTLVGDEERLFEWQECPSCEGPCSCAGIPYPSAAVRGAIDAAITTLYKGLKDGEPIDAVLRRRIAEQAQVEIAEAATKRIRAERQRDVANALLAEVRADYRAAEAAGNAQLARLSEERGAAIVRATTAEAERDAARAEIERLTALNDEVTRVKWHELAGLKAEIERLRANQLPDGGEWKLLTIGPKGMIRGYVLPIEPVPAEPVTDDGSDHG